MLENKKHVFWQALFLTALFFLVGLVLGVYLEQIRSDDFSLAFSQSEISLYDSFALGRLTQNNLVSCTDLKIASIDFADRIYEEARQLEKFDEKSKLTESLKSIHRKYDLLRTILWINVMDLREKCKDVNNVVYIYTYDTDDLKIRSKQIVWSRILSDLKDQRGDDIILIPIAVDSDLASLNSIIKPMNITEFPVVIVNDNLVLYDLSSVDDLERYV